MDGYIDVNRLSESELVDSGDDKSLDYTATHDGFLFITLLTTLSGRQLFVNNNIIINSISTQNTSRTYTIAVNQGDVVTLSGGNLAYRIYARWYKL